MFTRPVTRFGLAAAVGVLAADQACKWWMLAGLDLGARGPLTAAPFLDLVLVWNNGISYGLFPQHAQAGRWALIALSLAAITVLILWLARAANRFTALALGVIIGGAAGNLIDRLIHGAVADFFLFHAYGYHWYVFNLADAAIVAGVAMLLYDSLVGGHKSAQNQR